VDGSVHKKLGVLTHRGNGRGRRGIDRNQAQQNGKTQHGKERWQAGKGGKEYHKKKVEKDWGSGGKARITDHVTKKIRRKCK